MEDTFMGHRRSDEDRQYDTKVTAHKSKALKAIHELVAQHGLILPTVDKFHLDTILSELVTSTIVTSGGAFHAWKEQAK